MDQPAGLMFKLTAYLNVWDSFSAFGRASNKAKWVEQNPGGFEIVSTVMRLADGS